MIYISTTNDSAQYCCLKPKVLFYTECVCVCVCVCVCEVASVVSDALRPYGL